MKKKREIEKIQVGYVVFKYESNKRRFHKKTKPIISTAALPV